MANDKDPDDWQKEQKIWQDEMRKRVIETYRPDYNL